MSYRPFYAQLIERQILSRSFARLIFTGPDLKDSCLADIAPLDLRLKIIMPSKGHSLPDLTGEAWYQDWLDTDELTRGLMRTITLRQAWMDGDQLKISIDIVRHVGSLESGPLGSFCEYAPVESPVILIAPTTSKAAQTGIEFNPPAGADVYLYGDETAAPAIVNILETLPPDQRGRALIEVPFAEDAMDTTAPPGVEVRWLAREDRPHGELLQTVAGQFTSAKVHQPYFWIAGESSMVTALRRCLVKEVGIDKAAIEFMGYWKIGVAMRS